MVEGRHEMNETITDFLLARITEDERIAQRMVDELEDQIEAGGFTGLDANGPFTVTRMLSAQLWAYYDGQTRWRNFARGQYLARVGDPTRVLAECAAKRAIIEAADHGYLSYVAPLAAVYSDHPDYNPQWAI